MLSASGACLFLWKAEGRCSVFHSALLPWYNTGITKKEGTHMGKHILLINDLPGYGKVALAAMMPVLSHMGHHLYNLPTALVSNTLDYGKFEILETTDYMRKSLAVWKELGFSFDAISTGFIVSGEQAEMIAAYCGEERKKETYIFVDPIMGDEGHLYNGVPDSTVGAMRRLVSHADCTVPNYTEAALLAGVPYEEGGTSEREMRKIIDAIRRIGAASVVVTSAIVEGQHAVAGYDEVRGNYFLPRDGGYFLRGPFGAYRKWHASPGSGTESDGHSGLAHFRQ